MTHGRRKGVTGSRCQITGKIQFTSFDAAEAARVRTKGAERSYNDTCCGYWHISSMTVEEAQSRMAGVRPILDIDTTGWECTFSAEGGIVGTIHDEEAHHEAQGHDQAAAAEGWAGGPEPRAHRSRSAASPFQCGSPARLAPSPAALARRLEARSG